MCSSEEKKNSAKPKKKFLASELRDMHDILSKNMYKIRQRVRISNQSGLFHLIIWSTQISIIRWLIECASFQVGSLCILWDISRKTLK